MKKTSLTRTTPLVRTTPLARTTGLTRRPMTRRVSPRTKSYGEDLDEVRPVIVARSQGRCEAPGFVERWVRSGRCDGLDSALVDEALVAFIARREECAGVARHIHHRKYRTRLGTNHPDNLLHLCGGCHDFIHKNGRLSNALGLSLHAEQEETAP